MAIQQETGDKGEELAANYLKSGGYSIVEKNFRAGKSEIDLICQKGKLLVFVEVKTRSNTKFGNPESFVDEAKAAKVMEGAEAYIEINNWSEAIRFDIISIIIDGAKSEIEHFEDAFY